MWQQKYQIAQQAVYQKCIPAIQQNLPNTLDIIKEVSLVVVDFKQFTDNDLDLDVEQTNQTLEQLSSVLTTEQLAKKSKELQLSHDFKTACDRYHPPASTHQKPSKFEQYKQSHIRQSVQLESDHSLQAPQQQDDDFKLIYRDEEQDVPQKKKKNGYSKYVGVAVVLLILVIVIASMAQQK